MKSNYEGAYKIRLPMRIPVVIRTDGKSFHRYTRGLKRPFDEQFISAMNATAIRLCQEIQGAQLAYLQSDEISILVHNYKKLVSQAWFDNELQKMCSISAGIASAEMTRQSLNLFGEVRPAVFDSRVFIMPESEVNNLFLWRQNDSTRNSIQMVAQSLYSHKELHRKNNKEMQEMIFQMGQNWNDYPTHQKRGRCIVKQLYTATLEDGSKCVRSRWEVDNEVPIFSKATNYIEKHLEREE